MKKDGLSFGISGLGLVGMLIALAIVLLLAARAWSEMAPAALEVSGDSKDLVDTAPEGSAASPGHLPDLNEMKDATKKHEQQVEDIRAQIDAQPEKKTP